MRFVVLAALCALISGVAAQVEGNASVQSAINSAYQSVVRALDGQTSSVSFAQVQSAATPSAALVTSSVPNPAAGVVLTTSTVWLGSDGQIVSAPDASTSTSGGGLSNSAKLGIGLGVGLTAVIAFCTLAVLFVRRARRRQKLEFQRRTVGLRAMSMSEAEAA